MYAASAIICECPETSAQRVDHQNLRAKIRHTQQLIVQMEEENKLLGEKRAKLEEEVYQCEKETYKLRDKNLIKEKETKVLFYRIRDNTFCVIKENGKLEGKLKTKRRKYRLKMKNEISTLKRRISFITSELNKGQMTNEDTLSSIGATSGKREILEQRLIERNEQIAAAERAITELSTSIAAFRQDDGKFDTAHLQDALRAKRDDVQAILKLMDDKQNNLNLLESDYSQHYATMKEICAQIVTAKNTVKTLDGVMVSLSKDIEHQDSKRRSLSASIDDTKKKNNDLLTKQQDYQRENKDIAKTQAMLCRQQMLLLKQEQQLASEIKAAELLSQTLSAGLKYGAECIERHRQTNALCDDKNKKIEFELRRRELSLQQQFAREESQFEADVAALDEKIKLVDSQLCNP